MSRKTTQPKKPDDLSESAALAYSLRVLERRMRSESEVRAALTQRGFPSDVTAAVIARLRTIQLVDDANFARAWIADRARFYPRGQQRVRSELREKGVPDDVIARGFAESDFDESAIALELGRRYARRLAGLSQPQFSQRLWGYLGRRGFAFETVENVIRTLWREIGRTDAEL